MSLVFADALAPPALARLFNAGFSDYLVPLQLDEAALREHVRVHDIDLAASPVATDPDAAAFALLGVRGPDAWIGGMATAPPHRRRGLGRRVMVAALGAAARCGCETVWLEVVDANEAAIALYRDLGFAAVRDLDVWSLDAAAPAPPPASRPVDERTARTWIAARRGAPEPWQRADATLARLREGGVPLQALVVERAGAVVGAAVHRTEGASVGVLQIAARDDAAAAGALLAAAGGRAVHLANTPSDGGCARVLAGLGARLVARQHEMRLVL